MEENDKQPNDWSSGNAIDTMTMAAMIYGIFLITSKSKLIPNAIFFILMFILYMINTQRNYWHVRKTISDETNAMILNGEIVLFAISMITLFYGFTEYVLYQQSEYKNQFSWYTFILGSKKCASLKN